MTKPIRRRSVRKRIIILLLSALFLGGFLFVIISDRGGAWKADNSGKDERNNDIVIFLTKYGKLTLGMEGLSHEMLDGYMFELKPIQSVYHDNEIILVQRPSMNPVWPIRGTISFNGDYSRVTIEIQTEREGELQDFPGNGTYNMNE